jgi:hypothetical protein
VWHVDDLKVSHCKLLVVTKMAKWLQHTYKRLFDNSSGAMKVCRGKVHEYLGMNLDYSTKGEIKITMIPYIREILELFHKHDDSEHTSATPAADHLFKVNDDATPLPQEQATVFHNFVAKCLVLTKRASFDIATAVAFLTARVKAPNEDDWKKLVQMIPYLRGTIKLRLTLRADSAATPKGWVDGSHATHMNMCGHSGGCMSLGKGMPINTSTKS